MSDGPLAVWREKCRSGEIEHDPAQELAAEKLQSLHNALRDYSPAAGGWGASWKERFGLGRRTEEPPQGLYIYGDVGRGKSFIMELFYETAPVEKKRRVHFHAFMLEVHERLHRHRAEGKTAAGGKGKKRVDDLLPGLGRAIASETWLLCFDEFHVTNIADAMILGRLFQALFDRGVVVVTTSNWAPVDLYKDGLQRELFLPFIELIREKLDILQLEAAKDYRLARLMGMQVYYLPLGPAADKALDTAFARLTDDAGGAPVTLTVQGRNVTTKKAAHGVARFTFDELCGRALGPADYLAIADRFHTVILKDIPRLGEDERNEAKRFNTLIDALYENHVNLICSAEAAPQDLHKQGTHAFEFQRTASRLMEMQSAEYTEEGQG